MRWPALTISALVATTVAVVAPGRAETELPAERQLKEARERRATVEERLATQADDLEGHEEQVHDVEQEVAALEQRDQQPRAELSAIEDEIAMRSRLAFMQGDTTTPHVLLSADDSADVANGASVLGSLALRDRASMEDADVLRARAEVNRQLDQERLDALDALQADLQQQVDQLMADLEQLQRDEARFGDELRQQRDELRRQREAEERRREAAAEEARAAGGAGDAAPSAPSGGLACPVGKPAVFSDTWVAPRSGGRGHQGVDMMASHGTPVYAITSGRITWMTTSSLGGISPYIYGRDGNEYFYTHLQGYASGIGAGTTVGAGTLHFEVHPDGGSAVDPHPYAARACGR